MLLFNNVDEFVDVDAGEGLFGVVVNNRRAFNWKPISNEKSLLCLIAIENILQKNKFQSKISLFHTMAPHLVVNAKKLILMGDETQFVKEFLAKVTHVIVHNRVQESETELASPSQSNTWVSGGRPLVRSRANHEDFSFLCFCVVKTCCCFCFKNHMFTNLVQFGVARQDVFVEEALEMDERH